MNTLSMSCSVAETARFSPNNKLCQKLTQSLRSRLSASRRVACRTPLRQQQTRLPAQAAQQAIVVERVNSEAGSRKAFCEAFCRLLNLELATVDVPVDNTQSNFAAYVPPLSNVTIHKKRNYFMDRTWTATDVGYLAFLGAMHLLAVIAGPLTYTPQALTVCIVGYIITGWFGLSISYHRQLSHKSFRCPKILEYFFAYCGVLSLEGDPVEWVKNHTWHHRHSDGPADRHSPRDGIWHAHMGWLLDEQLTNTRKDSKGNMKDSLDVPWFFKESPGFYSWIRKTYMYHQIGQAVLLYLIGGMPWFIWGFVIRVLVTMHMTWLVNSAVHVWGFKDYESGDDSRNNWIVALLVFGDGWHNNHHAFEASAAHGLEWWQVDVSYYLIRSLEVLGLAWEVNRPPRAMLNRRKISLSKDNEQQQQQSKAA